MVCGLQSEHVRRCPWGEDFGVHGAWQLLLHGSELRDYLGEMSLEFGHLGPKAKARVNGAEGLWLALMAARAPLAFLRLRHHL